MSQNKDSLSVFFHKGKLFSFLLMFLLVSLACDPGCRYIPKHLEDSESNGFSLTVEGIKISVPALTLLLVQDFYLMPLTVENVGDTPIRLVEARFIGEQETFQAQMHSTNVVIDPEAEVDVLLRWEVDQGSFADALGEEPTLVLAFQSGRDSFVSEVIYQKVRI